MRAPTPPFPLQAWDDVVRKEKPKEDAFEYKKRLTLDQEKSKLSLAEIYEQEYIKLSQVRSAEHSWRRERSVGTASVVAHVHGTGAVSSRAPVSGGGSEQASSEWWGIMLPLRGNRGGGLAVHRGH